MKSMGDLLKRAIGQSEKLPPKYILKRISNCVVVKK